MDFNECFNACVIEMQFHNRTQRDNRERYLKRLGFVLYAKSVFAFENKLFPTSYMESLCVFSVGVPRKKK